MPSATEPTCRALLVVGCGGPPAEKVLSARHCYSRPAGSTRVRRRRHRPQGEALVRPDWRRDRTFSLRSASRAERGGSGGPLRGPGPSHGLSPWSLTTHLEHPLGRRHSRGLPRRGLALLRSAIVGLCLALASARGAALTPSDITDLYSDAKRCFREATALAETQPDAARDLFAKAALRFERLAREGGIRNGRLYYNLGNCYFRMEDLGRAILYYRRAEQYIPNDPNLRQNLDFARRKRLDRIDVPERTQALRTVLFFHYDLGQRARARIVALAFAALWLLLTIRIRVRSGWLSWAAAGFGVVSVLMLGSLAVEWQQMRSVRPGVVIAAETTARKGDGTSYEPAFTQPLHAGTEFRILEDRGEWVEVALDDGRRCWLAAADVEPVR